MPWTASDDVKLTFSSPQTVFLGTANGIPLLNNFFKRCALNLSNTLNSKYDEESFFCLFFRGLTLEDYKLIKRSYYKPSKGVAVAEYKFVESI